MEISHQPQPKASRLVLKMYLLKATQFLIKCSHGAYERQILWLGITTNKRTGYSRKLLVVWKRQTSMKRSETVVTSRQGGELSLHWDDYASPLECHEEASQKRTLIIIIMFVNFPFNYSGSSVECYFQFNVVFIRFHLHENKTMLRLVNIILLMEFNSAVHKNTISVGQRFK